VEELDAIPGVATTRADSIISARPFASVHEIILVEGVGNATFEKILAHGKNLTQRPVVAETNRKF
jgi:DNA uptake protein ComE-like DNA-binding protein